MPIINVNYLEELGAFSQKSVVTGRTSMGMEDPAPETRLDLIVYVLLIVLGTAPFCRGALLNSFPLYRNKIYNFCFEYPSTWQLNEGLDSKGVGIAPPRDERVALDSYISVGVAINQPRDLADPNAPSIGSPPMTLDENFESHLRALKDVEHISNVSILVRKHRRFQGFPALVSEIRFKKAGSAETYLERKWWIRPELHEDDIYILTLRCPEKSLEAVAPVFNHVRDTFRINCGGSK